MSDRSRYVARVQFLGTQRIDIGNEVVTPEAERLFAMIVRLSAPMGRITSRQTMMDTLWPGSDEANARHNLRQTVYKAREIGLVVESGEDGLRLDPRHWSCDWDDPEGDVDGEWLADYEPEFSSDLASWVVSQRVGVHALLRPRMIRSLQKARSSGDLIRADRYAVQLLQIDELNEEATLTRAELMAMQGAKVDALRLLDAYLSEIGKLGAGKDASLPAHLLRKRIAEKLPVVTYQAGEKHHGQLIGRGLETKRLIAGLFDVRAGRGGAVLLHGPEGSGKSRLMYEVKKSAVLQGMRILSIVVDRAPNALAFSTLRRIAARLLELPGAMGISPEALATIRGWIASDNRAPDDCPLFEIEDLFAAIAEETALLLLVENCSEIDAESLTSLDRLYRRGVGRYHGAVLTTCTRRTPAESAVEVRELERLSLRPMTLTEVRDVILAYAAEEMPRATVDQVNCAAAFAEGVPMYGIEMLGLMLDEGSPDVIPWRVKVAVERVGRSLTELQCRILALCELLGSSAKFALIIDTFGAIDSGLLNAVSALEDCGYLQAESDVFIPSALIAEWSMTRIGESSLRLDALRCVAVMASESTTETEPTWIYSTLRLLILAKQTDRAAALLTRHAGGIIRNDTAQNILYELKRARRTCSENELTKIIDGLCYQVTAASESQRRPHNKDRSRELATPLACVSPIEREIHYTLSSTESLDETMSTSRDPNLPPATRLAEAVTALSVAFNRNEKSAVDAAYKAVAAVRHSSLANQFDIHRADLMYSAFVGDREMALKSARLLAIESRVVQNVELACKGFRNSAEALCVFGDVSSAQALLHECRVLAVRLGYNIQIVWTDLELAWLAVEEMDVEGCNEYLRSAQKRCLSYGLDNPLLTADFHSCRCWSALIRGDFAQAQRDARVVTRTISRTESGTALWLRLGVELATHRGARSLVDERGFNQLKQSIGSCAFYRNEQSALTALLLYARDSQDYEEVSSFVSAQFDRLRAAGRPIWPFLISSLAAK